VYSCPRAYKVPRHEDVWRSGSIAPPILGSSVYVMHSSDILKDELINRTFSFVCVVSMGTSATDEGGNFVTEERSPDFCSCCVERELRSIGHWLYCCIFRIAIYRTPRSIVVFDKLIVAQLIKKIPAFYGTRRFITVFTSAHH
jgi:hypothetical protein